MQIKTNYFSYATKEGHNSGLFNIYQSKNGGIILSLNNVHTTLRYRQIQELSLYVYALIDFDIESFCRFYHNEMNF